MQHQKNEIGFSKKNFPFTQIQQKFVTSLSPKLNRSIICTNITRTQSKENMGNIKLEQIEKQKHLATLD